MLIEALMRDIEPPVVEDVSDLADEQARLELARQHGARDLVERLHRHQKRDDDDILVQG